MTMLRSARTSVMLGMLLGLAGGLAGCGGGGGDNASVTSVTPSPVSINEVDIQVQAALSDFARQSQAYTLSVTTGAVKYEMDYSFRPEAGTSLFEGRTVSTALQHTVLRKDGVVVQDQTLRTYFTTSPYVLYGAVDQTDGTYSVVDPAIGLPATARVGQRGSVGAETDYSDSAKTKVVGSAVLSWSLEADTATTALLCPLAVSTASDNSTTTECYRVDAAGSLRGKVFRFTGAGTTLVFQ